VTSDELKDLKKIPIFSSLNDGEIKEIQPYLIEERFKKKEEIFSEGETPEWFYILLNGKVKITKLSYDGKEIIIELISPPDFFGGLAVIKGFPYPANAIAMEDVEVLKVLRHDMLRIIDRFPNVMYDITSNLGNRIKEFHDNLKSIALEKVESRIAALLLKLADKFGRKDRQGETVIDMKLTKQDIAEMVGTTGETAIRVMSKFKKSGLIDDKAGKIIIKSSESLKAI
jgi:CRP/FNR family transcriptional regulator